MPDTRSLPDNGHSSPNLASNHTRLCAGITVPGLVAFQVTFVLSCAQLAGWSAEKISNQVRELFPGPITVMPEMIWYSCWNWEHVMLQASAEDARKACDDMLRILNYYSIEPEFEHKKLSDTPRPYTFPHSLAWFPYQEKIGIFDEYGVKARRHIVGQISWARTETSFLVPISVEQEICDSLGPEVNQIIRKLLRRWLHHIKDAVKLLPCGKKISRCPESCRWVAQFGKLFKTYWEETFGEMDDEYKNQSLVPRSLRREETIPIAIRSTGAAAKIFCCQMLVTRLVAFDNRREMYHDETAYLDVPLQDLPGDITQCVICQEELGKETEDGDIEMPIRVVACCGNYFGKACLRRWYSGAKRRGGRKCPLCNKAPGEKLLDKLLYWDNPEVSENIFMSKPKPARKGKARELEEGEILDYY